MFCSAADITQQGRQEVAQRLIHFNARNSIFKLSLNGHHCKPDWQASKQDHTVRLETQQKSFALRSELKHLFLLPLSWQYFLFELRHTHTHLLLPHLEKPPWSFVATATPKNHIHLHPGLKPLRHQTQQSRKHKGANGRGTHLPENVILPCFWCFLQHRMVNAPNCFKELLTSQADKTYAFPCGSLHSAFSSLDVTHCHAELLTRK